MQIAQEGFLFWVRLSAARYSLDPAFHSVTFGFSTIVEPATILSAKIILQRKSFDMKIFQRYHIIDFNLHPHTMEEVINFPNKNEAGLEEYFVKNVFHPNHLQIDARRRDSHTGGIHDLIFSPEEKQITIHSKFHPWAFFLYSSISLPLIPLVLSENNTPKEMRTLILITLGVAILCTVFLAVVIRKESKDVEREMILRINYLNRRRTR